MEPPGNQPYISGQPGPLPITSPPKGKTRERFRYTIIRTRHFYTIQELGVQLRRNGTVHHVTTLSLSPYRQSEIFETHETDPVKIIAAYKTFRRYGSGSKKRHIEHEETAAGKKAMRERWQILHDEKFLKGLALAIKKSLPGGYLHAAGNQQSFYVHWRQYNIRISDHEQPNKEYTHGDNWRPNPEYGPEKYIGVILKLGKEEKAWFMIGGGKLRIPMGKIDKGALYRKVIEYLAYRGAILEEAPD